MKYQSNLLGIATGNCPHEQVELSQTGGWHFDGEPWDDIVEVFICLDCGCSVYPVEDHEPLLTTELLPV